MLARLLRGSLESLSLRLTAELLALLLAARHQVLTVLDEVRDRRVVRQIAEGLDATAAETAGATSLTSRSFAVEAAADACVTPLFTAGLT
ncbi:hypothetical protein GCM10025867_09380 [Frondihabitans sucicola]|uniref:Secreted protein n=1 Tax=Frondihabitans sucicola TaxID=1268041 RepID=A0ABM8GJY8_9MICO|nr:hypothetical protein GCM10025867_09380 [Frondihabitans sucicola]